RSRHNANNGEQTAIEAKRFADDVGIGRKAASPKSIADNHGGWTVKQFLSGVEFPPQRWGNTPGFKKMRIDPGASDFFGEDAGAFGDVLGVITIQGLERGVEARPVFEARRCNHRDRVAALRIMLRQ